MVIPIHMAAERMGLSVSIMGTSGSQEASPPAGEKSVFSFASFKVGKLSVIPRPLNRAYVKKRNIEKEMMPKDQ